MAHVKACVAGKCAMEGDEIQRFQLHWRLRCINHQKEAAKKFISEKWAVPHKTIFSIFWTQDRFLAKAKTSMQCEPFLL